MRIVVIPGEMTGQHRDSTVSHVRHISHILIGPTMRFPHCPSRCCLSSVEPLDEVGSD
jgi:hypothetical protein